MHICISIFPVHIPACTRFPSHLCHAPLWYPVHACGRKRSEQRREERSFAPLRVGNNMLVVSCAPCEQAAFTYFATTPYDRLADSSQDKCSRCCSLSSWRLHCLSFKMTCENVRKCIGVGANVAILRRSRNMSVLCDGGRSCQITSRNVTRDGFSSLGRS